MNSRVFCLCYVEVLSVSVLVRCEHGLLFCRLACRRLTNTIHLTLKMTSAQVVETSVTNNSSFQNYSHPDDHIIRTTEREYVTDQIQSNPGNSNNIWKAIRHCLPKNSASSRTYSRDDKTVADNFNNF